MGIIELLRKDALEWIPLLTDEEIYAIRKYSYNSFEEDSNNKFYSRLNSMLRGEIDGDSTLQNYVEIISSALKKCQTKRRITCYRRVNINPVSGFAPGDIVKLYQFVSTSVIESKTLPGKVEMIITIPEGCHAAYIEQISKYPKQRELLLDKDCIYRILFNQENIVKLEVIS